MSTLTPMERTVTGWKCPMCGNEVEGHTSAVAVECDCTGGHYPGGVMPFRYGLSVTLTPEELRERYPRLGRWYEEEQ